MTSPFPSPPHVEPPPPLGLWLVLDARVIWGDPITLLAFQTDAPVHLYLQYTETPPHAQPRRRVVRGVSKRTGTYWSMDRGLWAEQVEPGDTTTHTFRAFGWPPGAPLWYFLRGRQRNMTTRSTSILFGSVRPVPNFQTTNSQLLTVSIGNPLQVDASAINQPTTSVAP